MHDFNSEHHKRTEFLYQIYLSAQHRNSGKAGPFPVNSADTFSVYQAMRLNNAESAPLLFYHLSLGNVSVSTPYPDGGIDKDALSDPCWQRGSLMAIFPHQIFITPKGIEAIENDGELWNRIRAKRTPIPTPEQVVEKVLSRPCSFRYGDTVPTSSSFIFSELDAVLTAAQKRLYLVLIENTRWKDKEGQEHLKSPFTLEINDSLPESREIRTNLNELCKVGLLALQDDGTYGFKLPGFAISNYLTLREFYEGDGRAKLSPNLNYKRVVLPKIPASAKSVVQLLKSIQRRLYEEQTGNLLQFQDKDIHDYESITRVSFIFQAPHFFIEPALSFEIIPLEPARVKVIAECYHVLAEEVFNVFLKEVVETWPDGPTEDMARHTQEADITLSTLEHKWPDLPADMLQERLTVWELWDKQRLKLYQITSQVNCSESTTKRHLDALEAAGLLRRKRKKMNAR